MRSFNGPSGKYPDHALTPGNDGNFYGVTPQGGANGDGEVFRVTPAGTVTVLHSFNANVDGYNPECTLVLASNGDFYGTTQYGGPQRASGTGDYGNGTVFQITPGGTFTVLHTFYSDAFADGTQPQAGLVEGSEGLLYGTTSSGGGGGGSGDGTIFQISITGAFRTLHPFDFHQTGTGGYGSTSPLARGRNGTFYGVASGGDNGVGTVFNLAADGTYTTLYDFNVTDGSGPIGGLTQDGGGNFYGMTQSGGQRGASGDGTIYKITTDGVLTTLHNFGSTDAGAPSASGFLLATDGNLYAAAEHGGNYYGNIFQCTLTGTLTDVHDFTSDSGSYYPAGGLAQAGDGTFYGTTTEGGASLFGTVFHLAVGAHPPFFDGETDLGSGVEYLAFPNGNVFGFYEFLSDPHYVYHFDLGFEYVFNAADGSGGVFLYDFTSKDFFYTSPTFPFPFLYDFDLETILYYYPDPAHAGRYNTNGVRYFYNFATGEVITK